MSDIPSTTTVTEDVLAVMLLFNILSAFVAMCLYFRLVSLVKQGHTATDDCQEQMKRTRTLVNDKHAHILEVMMLNQEHLDNTLELNVLTLEAKIRSVQTELLRQSGERRKELSDLLKLSNSKAIDPPTESDDSASSDEERDTAWEVVFETIEVDTSEDLDSKQHEEDVGADTEEHMDDTEDWSL